MIHVVLQSLSNATPEGTAFAGEAVSLLERIVNDSRFLERVRRTRYSYTSRRTDDDRYVRTSTDEIAEIIATGKELETAPNDRIELQVVLEPMAAGTLGIVYLPDPLIHTNTAFFEACRAERDPLSLAAHWLHEWMHVAGFYHRRFWKSRDVAYQCGYIVSALGLEMRGANKLGKADAPALGLLYLMAADDDSCPVVVDDDLSNPEAAAAFAHQTGEAAAPEIFAVDVHAHTFNASDLSVSGFIRDVVIDTDEHRVLRLVDPLVRMLVRVIGRAPGAEDEMRRLDALGAARLGLMDSAAEASAASERAAREAETESRVAAEVERLRTSTDEGDQELFRALAEEAGTIAAFAGESAAVDASRIVRAIFSFPGTVGRYVRWVGKLRGYRHELLDELVRTYGEVRGSVSLFTPSLVDFARWVKDEPATPLDVQVLLCSRLARAFPGRVHFMAAFDPWREADHPGSTFGSLYWARHAVMDHGFVGVKLYPPMGFSALGNASHDFSRVTREESRAFGARLDEALARLFAWAEAEEVPLLAHCNDSLGSKHGYARRASPEYWRRALERYPRLRLNLGHFGGQEKLGIPGEWPELIIGLMNDFEHVYADIGMFHLRGDRARAEWFDRLAAAMERDPILESRLLYGSDWVMLAKEKGSADFFTIFAAELQRRFTPQVARAVLGDNARRYLGITSGKAAGRLQDFYRTHGLATPDWLGSVTG